MGIGLGPGAVCKNRRNEAGARAGGIVDRGARQSGGGCQLLSARGNVSICRGSCGRCPHSRPLAALAFRRLDWRADLRLCAGVRAVTLFVAAESGQHWVALDFGGSGFGDAVISPDHRRPSRGPAAVREREVKRRSIVAGLFALALLAPAAYLRYVPGRTPAGQPPLANLDQASFERQFRAAAAGPRVLVLLSPT